MDDSDTARFVQLVKASVPERGSTHWLDGVYDAARIHGEMNKAIHDEATAAKVHFACEVHEPGMTCEFCLEHIGEETHKLRDCLEEAGRFIMDTINIGSFECDHGFPLDECPNVPKEGERGCDSYYFQRIKRAAAQGGGASEYGQSKEDKTSPSHLLREAAVRANAALGWAVDDMNGNTSPSWMAFEEKYGKGPGAADEAYSACVALRDLLAPTVAQGGGAI